MSFICLLIEFSLACGDVGLDASLIQSCAFVLFKLERVDARILGFLNLIDRSCL